MTPNHIHLVEDLVSPDDVPSEDLDALRTAKARQDLSHQKLDEFIAAALAQLSDEVRAA